MEEMEERHQVEIKAGRKKKKKVRATMTRSLRAAR